MASGGPNDTTLLLDFFGPPSYNNLNDPIPWCNRPETLRGLTITFLVLSWLFVSARLFVRLRVVKAPGWDDLFVFLYLVFSTITSIAFLKMVDYGAGQHYLLLTFGQFKMFLVNFYVMIGAMTETLAFVKMSLLFQFLRIFKRGTWQHRACVFGNVFIALWCLAFAIMAWFPCTRVSDVWNPFNPDRHCWATASSNHAEFVGSLVAYTVINMVLDLFITFLAFQIYFQSTVTFRTRVGLVVLLFMGAIANVLSVWRLQDTIYHVGSTYPTMDPTWYGPQSTVLAVLESEIASVCASVPIFWPVLGPYLGSIFVTREVSVEHEYRVRPGGGKGAGSEGNDTGKLGHGRTGSEAELNRHYEDPYVLDQVMPFDQRRSRPVQSRISGSSGGDRTKKRPWFRF